VAAWRKSRSSSEMVRGIKRSGAGADARLVAGGGRHGEVAVAGLPGLPARDTPRHLPHQILPRRPSQLSPDLHQQPEDHKLQLP
jgi:hypothetical protein